MINIHSISLGYFEMTRVIDFRRSGERIRTHISLFLFWVAEAFQHVSEHVDEIDAKAGASETDLVFLKGILDSPAVTQIIKVSRERF